MSKKADRDALAAAMAAFTGTVTKVAEGEVARPDLDAKAWRRRAHLTASERSDGENALIEERHIVVGSNGREYVRNGLGEWIG